MSTTDSSGGFPLSGIDPNPHEVCGREIAQLMEEAREKDAEIERLKEINIELIDWVKKRKNKLHPMDSIHKLLQRAEEGKP